MLANPRLIALAHQRLEECVEACMPYIEAREGTRFDRRRADVAIALLLACFHLAMQHYLAAESSDLGTLFTDALGTARDSWPDHAPPHPPRPIGARRHPTRPLTGETHGNPALPTRQDRLPAVAGLHRRMAGRADRLSLPCPALSSKPMVDSFSIPGIPSLKAQDLQRELFADTGDAEDRARRDRRRRRRRGTHAPVKPPTPTRSRT